MSTKEIMNDFKEKYAKVRKLLDEESKNDPETEPYSSKYKAREILCNMRNCLLELKKSDSEFNATKIDAMLGAVVTNIGVVDMETEDLTSGEKFLTEAVALLSDNATLPEVVITLLNAFNNLGILWSNLQEPEKAKTFLIKAKSLYEDFKCTLKIPLTVEYLFGIEDCDPNDFLLLEKGHTLTLYYLAQIYGTLQEAIKSAVYCHTTLRRQLQYSDYEPIDWALNSATLSQFFAEQNGFHQSRHHLAAASAMLDQHEAKLRASESTEQSHLAKLETLNHRSADVARCWAKYCLNLLSSSKQRLMEDSEVPPDGVTDMSNLTLDDEENICGGDLKSLTFPGLDVAKYESKITDKYLLTYEDAKEVFLACQSWLNKAKEYYRLDTLASDHIELIQDCSQSYSYLTFFEEDDERRAKMHKRRITLLEDLVKEVNPTYYLQYCRQMWYELGEVYSEILNIKLDKNKDNGKPNPQVLQKINHLCEKSIENYDKFIGTVKDKNGSFPKKLDFDLIRPVITALAFVGRNSMKRIAVDKSMQLSHVRKSFDCYQAVVDVCKDNEDAAAMMSEEYSLCQSMVNILPIKIKKLESEVFT